MRGESPGARMESPRVSRTPLFSTKNITEVLLLLGTALLIYWQPLSDRILLKASDGVFVIAIGLCVLFIMREGRARTLKAANVWFIPPLLASIVVATLMGHLHYHLGMGRTGIILMGRLLTCIALFLAVYSLQRHDTPFRRLVSLAFLSPLALFPAMMIPNLFTAMWDSTGRFQGLTPNPNTAAMALLIAFALAYTLGAYEAGMRHRLRALAFFGVAVGMMALILWSGSRGYLAAAFVSALLGTVFVTGHHRLPKLKFVLVVVSSLALIVTGILLLEPRRFTGAYLTHISRVRSNMLDVPTTAPKTLPTLKRLQRFVEGIIPTLEDDIRTPAIRYYSKLLSTNYLGLGLNYESKFTVYHAPTGTYHGTNTILDLPVYGGIGAVLSVAYLALLVGRRTKQTLAMAVDDNAPYTIAAVTALAGLWSAAVLVGSPLFDYQFWILTAIVLA